MPRVICHLDLADADATARLGQAFADRLDAGDVLLLDGQIGAGKTHFARALIQSLMDRPEDVPSPTFTLVQTYEIDRGSIWHADLYRLTSVHEVEELGLIEAFDTAICLVEWPDRLGELWPKDALHLRMEPGVTDMAREVTLVWNAGRWGDLLQGLAA